MRTIHLLTVSHSIPCILGESAQPLLDTDLPWIQIPLNADPPNADPHRMHTPPPGCRPPGHVIYDAC